jgi:hypothetical protein
MVESSNEFDEENEEIDSSVQSFEEPVGGNVSPGDPGTSQKGQDTCTSQDEQLQQEWNEDIELASTSSSHKGNDSDSTVHVTSTLIKDKQDVIYALSSQVEANYQFFIATRRKAPLSRTFSLWQCQAKKRSPTCTIMVKYSGEARIDRFRSNCKRVP